MTGEMLILSEIERNKDPKTTKTRIVVRKYKITNVIDISSIKQAGTKAKNTSKSTEGKMI